ncbi:MAG: SpoIIE family protein phosphatase [Phycisphaerae bacterium]|nr:SpoIIE family protein phosphatase [Phycisphaerae bacterium]
MKIRWKLLILLLAIALAPLMVWTGLHLTSMRRLGGQLASDRRTILTETARHYLRRIVDDYGRIIARDAEILELALRIQADEVEDRLAQAPPVSPRLFFGEDYDNRVSLPAGMVLSDKHRRSGPDGKVAPIQVTYDQQVCVLAPGIDRKVVADDLARLSTMPKVYRPLYVPNSKRMYWQYTALETGIHTCYPGHGGYPPDYDPRKRQWYRRAKTEASLIWTLPMVEVSTRTVALTLAIPVRRPDGSFAGVTAIDVPLGGVFSELALPKQWASDASRLVVFPGSEGDETEEKLVILAQQSYRGYRENWRGPELKQYLESEDTDEFKAMFSDAVAGKSGVRKMRYRGRDAMWAYGAGGADEAFPVVIVPYEKVIAHAIEAEKFVLDRMAHSIRTAGVVMLCVAIAVIIVAFLVSRRVTKPLVRLSQAGERLAGGDYDASVQIRTGDELQNLGEMFNDMGPKLREREKMKRSLDLAMEIQQHLLPAESPRLPGFDIAGTSLYCDETGGDYYDFIDLVDLGAGKLGIAVGDVTGHGIGAALLMASARGVLRSHAGRHGGDLSKLFKTLNTHLVRDTGEERFMTLFYGVLDAATRSLEWTSGGHDPAILLRRSTGLFEELPSTGVPLGIVEGATFESVIPVTLAGGDVIAIGTDGIWEATNAAGDMFGKDRMREVLSARSDSSAADIYAAIVEAVNEFLADLPQQDDITLVIIKAM